ncbi:MAG: tRNA pseudouridine(55) synthase TruB [Candidatus Hydrogenedentes bacterium]|nr:tRNA pseudouridine(55) synthase TruB [Candidatus Hydrogenedentota bacterium]
MNGILLVDKSAGMTSHDVVDRIRSAAGIRRVGHTGTLDPAATGLLILCLGAATRLSEFLTGLDKVYEGTMRLGLITDSYDLDGRILEERPVPGLTAEAIQNAFDAFTGDIMQTPPMVSAVKIGGERLYKKARKGEVVDRPARPVTVREFRLLGFDTPLVHFRVRCTRGTYARSLCHEVGQMLGCGGALSLLRRTWVGHHSVDEAAPVESFATRDDVLRRMAPLEGALQLPEVVVLPNRINTVLSGGVLGRADLQADCPVTEGWVQVKSPTGKLLALAQVQNASPHPALHPKRVLCAQT